MTYFVTNFYWLGDEVGGWYASNLTATTDGHFVLYPLSLASRDQDRGPSNSTIGIYDLREK